MILSLECEHLFQFVCVYIYISRVLLVTLSDGMRWRIYKFVCSGWHAVP